MKKKILLGSVCALSLAIVLAAVLLPKRPIVTVCQVAASVIDQAETVSELQQVADTVVVFTPQQQENVTNHYSDGNVSFGYTKTIGTVEQVLSGECAAGDTLCITEGCYTTNLGTVLWTHGGYLPMNPGERYLLFLISYDPSSAYKGMYYPVDMEYGRYVMPHAAPLALSEGETRTAADFELNEYADVDTYSQWYEAVFALYPELTQ